mgnify:CR=1 FL=1
MKLYKLIFIFLAINFGALAFGSWLMDNGPMTDWYINLMKQDAYESKALPITMQFEEYIQGTNDYLPFAEDSRVPQAIDIAQFIKLIHQKKNLI